MHHSSLFEKRIEISVKVLIIIVLVSLLSGGVVGYALSIQLLEREAESSLVVEAKTVDLSSEVVEEREPFEQEDDICVDVSGAVNLPGVYCLPAGSLINEAISKAGEVNSDLFASGFVRRYINLSKRLIDNEKVYIPYEDEIACTPISFDPKTIEMLDIDSSDPITLLVDEKAQNHNDSDDNLGNTECININNATIEELESITGIGESTAKKIADSRPYSKLEELLDVNGIGETKYEAMIDSICL
jgi:competence protein ComEA